MTRLSMQLFGNVVLKLDNVPITLPTRKAEALLAYLVCQGRPVAREILASMFWDDSHANQAAANLRKLLSILRQSLGDYLLIDRQIVTVTIDQIWLDTREFARLLATWQQNSQPISLLTEAVSLYEGDFLAHLHLSDSPDFNAWASLERERWQHQVVTALYALGSNALHTRQHEIGLRYVQQLLTLAPLQEMAHRLYMLLLARSGQIAAALTHYEQCCARLQKELGVLPTLETQALATRIATAVSHPHVLPIPDTPFIGRDQELAYIQQQLDDPTCRLLTLVGTGGIGKSRLALQAAQEHIVDFLHGIYFVSLATLETAVSFIPTLAAALGILLDGKQPPAQQLLAALQSRELLLILDNCETLLTENTLSAADFVLDILQHTTRVKILATSQERFNFPGEYIIEVDGLPFSEHNADSAAVALFTTRAAKVQPHFRMTPATAPAIVTICRLVAGAPLGIELAAAAMSAYTPAEIAAEIAADLDFLAVDQPNVPPRHLSLRAAFNYTWRHLLPEEQKTLQYLSVFRGSFTLETAVLVTQTTLPHILSLVDKSILRFLADSRLPTGGRYQIHPMLRRFSMASLTAEAATVQQLHSRHYTHLLATYELNLIGANAAAALTAIWQEWDDIRAAWDWAVRHADTLAVQEALTSFLRYYLLVGPFQEAADLLTEAIAMNTEQPLLARLHAEQARILNKLGIHETAVTAAQTALALSANNTAVFITAQLQWGAALIGLGRFETAITHLMVALAHAENIEDQPSRADILRSLGSIAAYQGNYLQARTYYQQARLIYEQIGDQRGVGGMHNNLGVTHRNLEDYDTARHHYEQALSIMSEIGDIRGESQIRNNLGVIARSQGDYAQARMQYEAALLLKRSVGDQQGEALALNNLANVTAELGDYANAQTYFQQALTIFRQLGRRRDQGMVLSNLGLLQHLRGDHAAAQAYSQQALTIATELGDRSTMAFALIHLGHALSELGEQAMAQDAYRQSHLLRTELSESALAVESMAGLARTYPPSSQEALTCVTKILAYLQENALTGSEQPLRIYLTCYQVLQAHQDARATPLLETAQQLLKTRADCIGDPTMRQSFLENVSAHRTISAYTNSPT